MRTPRPTAALLLAAALLSTVLAACADDPPPPAPPDSPTAPATPRPALPPISERSQEFTADGAASFVAYYVSLLDYASKAGDVQELTRVSDPDCEGCNRYIDTFEEMGRKGGYSLRDWSRSVTQMRFRQDQRLESFATTFLTISAGELKLTADEELRTYAKTRNKVTFALIFNVEWRMTQFGIGDLG